MSTMIKVEVRLYATLRKYRPELEVGEPLSLQLPEKIMVRQLLEEKLGIPAAVVKIVFVNGRQREVDHSLAEGDRVAVFPPVGGG